MTDPSSTATGAGTRSGIGNAPTNEMTRDYAFHYETPPVTTEIDRRSGCSVTYSDCAFITVDPAEASLRITVDDAEHDLVLLRIEQWSDGTTITDPIFTCSDMHEEIRLRAATEQVDISFETGRCPDGRRAGASKGVMNVTFYEGSRLN